MHLYLAGWVGYVDLRIVQSYVMSWDCSKSSFVLKFFSPILELYCIVLYCIVPQQHCLEYGQKMLPGPRNMVHHCQSTLRAQQMKKGQQKSHKNAV
jgi:hypothetical protein